MKNARGLLHGNAEFLMNILQRDHARKYGVPFVKQKPNRLSLLRSKRLSVDMFDCFSK